MRAPRLLFVECRTCGERWAIGMLPIDLGEFIEAGKKAKCQNCGESKAIGTCNTAGDDAVRSPRRGKAVSA